MVPELVRLKNDLELLHSPLLHDLMVYFIALYKTGRQVKDIVKLAFPNVSNEIEYDLKKFEEKQQEQQEQREQEEQREGEKHATNGNRRHSAISRNRTPQQKTFSSTDVENDKRGETNVDSNRKPSHATPTHRLQMLQGHGSSSKKTPTRQNNSSLTPFRNKMGSTTRKVSSPSTPGTPGRNLRHVLSQTPGLHALKRARISHTPTRPKSATRPVMKSAAKSWSNTIVMKSPLRTAGPK